MVLDKAMDTPGAASTVTLVDTGLIGTLEPLMVPFPVVVVKV